MVDALNLMAAHAPVHVIIGNHEIDRRAPEHLIAAVYVPIDSNYLGIAEEMIRQFESIDVDAIIGLTHLYISQDVEIAGLRVKHPKFVFIAGGHDHEPEYSPLSSDAAAVMKLISRSSTVAHCASTT